MPPRLGSQNDLLERPGVDSQALSGQHLRRDWLPEVDPPNRSPDPSSDVRHNITAERFSQFQRPTQLEGTNESTLEYPRQPFSSAQQVLGQRTR